MRKHIVLSTFFVASHGSSGSGLGYNLCTTVGVALQVLGVCVCVLLFWCAAWASGSYKHEYCCDPVGIQSKAWDIGLPQKDPPHALTYLSVKR